MTHELKTGGDRGYKRIATEEAFATREQIDGYLRLVRQGKADRGVTSLWGFYAQSPSERARLVIERLALSFANTAASASSLRSAPSARWRARCFAPSIRLSVRHASGSGPASCRATLLSPDWRWSDGQEASTSVAHARTGPPQRRAAPRPVR